jgi:hypothetical protein
LLQELGALLLLVCTLAAVSCRSLPPTPPDLPKQQNAEVIGWEISPTHGYEDQYGFIRLSFTPPSRLTVHIGRLELDHADTAWYGVTVTEGASTLINFVGEEGIPNIKGPDGNWWNDLDLVLPHPLTAELHITIHDMKINLAYAFILRETVLPEKVDLQGRVRSFCLSP